MSDTPDLRQSKAPTTFRELHDLYLPFVRKVAQRFRVDAGSVDDVCQEVFLVAHRLPPVAKSSAELKVWIYRTARNVILTHLRTARRRSPFRGTDSDSAPPEALPSPLPGPFEEVSRDEMVERALRATRRVGTKSMEAFWLMDIMDLTAPEAAAWKSTNVNTMYARVGSARQMLARVGRAVTL